MASKVENQVIEGSIATLITQLVVVFIGVVTTFLIARVLGPSGKGLFTITLTLASILVTIFHSSLGFANAHFASQSPELRPSLLGNGIALSFIGGGIFTFLVAIFFTNLRQNHYPIVSDRLWVIVLLAIIPLLLQELSNGLVFGMESLLKMTATLLGKELVFLSLVIVLIMLNEGSTFGFISLWLAIAFIGSSLMLIQAFRSTSESPFIEVTTMLKALKFGINYHSTHIFTLLRLRFDPLLIGLFLTSDEVGYYSIVMAFIAGIWSVPAIFGPYLLKHFRNFGIEPGYELISLTLRTCFSLVVVIAVLIALFGPPLIALFPGKQFLPAYQALLLLLPGSVLYTISQLLSGILEEGMVDRAQKVGVWLFISNIVLSLLLIPKFGILGAAASTTIVNSVAGLMFLHLLLIESGMNLSEVLILKKDDLYIIFRSGG